MDKGRTISAIINKAYTLNLKISKNTDGIYTVNYVADKFKINSTTIAINCANNGKIKRRKSSNNYSYSYIEVKELFRFLKDNQDLWNAYNLEENEVSKRADYGKRKLIKNSSYYLSDDDPLVKKYKIEKENK